MRRSSWARAAASSASIRSRVAASPRVVSGSWGLASTLGARSGGSTLPDSRTLSCSARSLRWRSSSRTVVSSASSSGILASARRACSVRCRNSLRAASRPLSTSVRRWISRAVSRSTLLRASGSPVSASKVRASRPLNRSWRPSSSASSSAILASVLRACSSALRSSPRLADSSDSSRARRSSVSLTSSRARTSTASRSFRSRCTPSGVSPKGSLFREGGSKPMIDVRVRRPHFHYRPFHPRFNNSLGSPDPGNLHLWLWMRASWSSRTIPRSGRWRPSAWGRPASSSPPRPMAERGCSASATTPST